MFSEVDLWLQCIITIPEIPILGGIWSFAAYFLKPEVAILNFITAFGDNFRISNVILVVETLILGAIWSFSAVFQKPEVAILQSKMLPEVGFETYLLPLKTFTCQIWFHLVD